MIHLHKWSLWSEPQALENPENPKQFIGYAQTRRCRVCGKVSCRTVRL